VVASVNPASLRLVSGPYGRRVGLIPMTIALTLGWIFAGLWLSTAIFILPYNLIWSLVLTASTTLFSVYLGFVTYTMIADCFREYVLELTETEAILSVFDRLRKRRSTQMVLLDDIKYAEYYPFSDSASIIFHAPYTDMEVPLWPMGSRGQDVVDFLDGRGVTVVNVQSDDDIPD